MYLKDWFTNWGKRTKYAGHTPGCGGAVSSAELGIEICFANESSTERSFMQKVCRMDEDHHPNRKASNSLLNGWKQ